jgi:DNA-binding LacI/PurR family transcriptional regulator
MKRAPNSTKDRVEQRMLAMLGTFWPKGTRLPPLPLLAKWMDAGESNTYLATRRLVERGYLMSRPGAGTVVVRTPVDVEEEAAPILGKRIAIRALKGRLPSEAESALRSTLKVAGGAVTTVVASPSSDNLLESADFAGFDALAIVHPYEYSPVRFDPPLSVVVLAASAVVTVQSESGYDLVSPNDEQGSFLAGRHARRLGAKNACVVGVADLAMPDEFDPISRTRLCGFEEGFGSRIPDPCRLMARRYTEAAGAQLVALLSTLDPLPDVVFAASDELAVGLMRRAAETGLIAGQHFMLIGFDGQLRGLNAPGGPLTTIVRPERQLGEAAADFLMGRLANPNLPPRRVLLGCTLFEGSTARSLASSPRAATPLLSHERKAYPR